MALTNYIDEIIKIRVPGDGPCPCPIMLIGERPGKDEPRAGRPFVGIAGRELDRFLKAGGLYRDDLYITNLVKTYNKGDHPTQEEIDHDLPSLLEEIRRVNPSLIVPMGAFAIHHIMGPDYTVDMVHGVPRWSDSFSCTVFPTYHPAAGFYDAETQPTIIDDFVRLGRYSRGELVFPTFPEPLDYAEIASPADISDVQYIIPSIDTEGSTARPWCLTYSSVDGRARLIRGSNRAALDAFADQLDSAKFVYLHNSTHDLAVLRGLGIAIPEGKFRDTMVLAYILSVEPQGLKALAYRHLGMEMMSYGELTSKASREKCVDYLEGVGGIEWPDPEPYTVFERGSIKIKKPQNLNRRIKSILRDVYADKKGKAGGLVDPIDRWFNIDEYLRQPAELLLGELPEATLDDIPFDRALDYACTDAIATNRIAPYLEREIRRMDLERVVQVDHAVLPIVDRMMEVGFPVGGQEVWGLLVDKCDAIIDKCKYQIEKMTGARINLDSGDQVAALLYGQLGLPQGKLTKGSKNEDGSWKKEPRASTNEKSMSVLVSLHPVVPVILEGKHASKAKSSFGVSIPRHAREGRIHATINTTRVITGRFSAKNPNLTAIPVRSELGKDIRNCFVAAPGRILSSHDLDQAEMRMMAHESEDPLMCTVLSDPRRDIHSETGALIFGIKTDWSSKYAGVDKMRHRYPAKRVGFGVITGITGIGLKDQMDLAGATKNGKPIGQGGDPWTVDDCDKLIAEWFKIYKGARAYMDRKRAEALRDGYVKDWIGRIRYLPGVYSPIRHIREEALRQSHSHSIQAGAQAIIKIAMANVWEWLKMWRGEGRYAEMLLQIHDELIHEWEDGDEKWLKHTDEMIVMAMQHSVKLRVPVLAKGSYGYKWGELKD